MHSAPCNTHHAASPMPHAVAARRRCCALGPAVAVVCRLISAPWVTPQILTRAVAVLSIYVSINPSASVQVEPVTLVYAVAALASQTGTPGHTAQLVRPELALVADAAAGRRLHALDDQLVAGAAVLPHHRHLTPGPVPATRTLGFRA